MIIKKERDPSVKSIFELHLYFYKVYIKLCSIKKYVSRTYEGIGKLYPLKFQVRVFICHLFLK